MRIAVLGATSQIARDFVQASAATSPHRFCLFARRPDAVQRWASALALDNIESIAGFETFSSASAASDGGPFDAILNCVGVGNPAAAQAMGASILDTTLEFDTLALQYVSTHPATRYLFLSSGAAYGSDFSQPATPDTPCRFNINQLGPQDWYGAAKFHAECRHRALQHLPIVDIRVFSYFSHSQDLGARFLVSDILRAIDQGHVLETGADNIVRDYIGPAEFASLVNGILSAAPVNTAVDTYSAAPVDKFTLLHTMQQTRGLRWQTPPGTRAISHGINATGLKAHYHSLNRHAADVFGFDPRRTALQVILDELERHPGSTSVRTAIE